MANNDISNWLRKIFTAKKISIIIATLSLLVTTIAFISTTSGKLSIKINDKTITFPKRGNDSPKVAELCFVNDSSFSLGDYANLPILNNKSSRSIKNLNYEVKIIQHSKCDYRLDDNFERINSSAFYKKENLKAFQSVGAPISTISLPQQQAFLEFVYNISFDGASKPIIMPYYLFIYNTSGHRMTEEQYVSLRNSFLKNHYETFKNVKNSPIYITVGDTTVLLKDPKILNLGQSEIISLSDLENDENQDDSNSLSPWVKVLFTILMAILILISVVISCFLFAALFETIKKIKRFPSNKDLNTELEISWSFLIFGFILLIFTCFGCVYVIADLWHI